MMIAGASLLLSGCIPEPQLDYPDHPLDFAQHVPGAIPRGDAEPPPILNDDLSGMIMDLGPNQDMDFNPPEIGTPELGPPDLGQPVLRTQSLHFVGTPTQRVSSGDVTVYGYFGWWTTSSNRDQ